MSVTWQACSQSKVAVEWEHPPQLVPAASWERPLFQGLHTAFRSTERSSCGFRVAVPGLSQGSGEKLQQLQRL